VDFHERIGVAALCVQVERDHMKSGKSGNVFKFNAAAVAFRLHHQGATLVVACSGSYNAFVEEGPVAVGAEKESVVGEEFNFAAPNAVSFVVQGNITIPSSFKGAADQTPPINSQQCKGVVDYVDGYSVLCGLRHSNGITASLQRSVSPTVDARVCMGTVAERERSALRQRSVYFKYA